MTANLPEHSRQREGRGQARQRALFATPQEDASFGTGRDEKEQVRRIKENLRLGKSALEIAGKILKLLENRVRRYDRALVRINDLAMRDACAEDRKRTRERKAQEVLARQVQRAEERRTAQEKKAQEALEKQERRIESTLETGRRFGGGLLETLVLALGPGQEISIDGTTTEFYPGLNRLERTVRGQKTLPFHLVKSKGVFGSFLLEASEQMMRRRGKQEDSPRRRTLTPEDIEHWTEGHMTAILRQVAQDASRIHDAGKMKLRRVLHEAETQILGASVTVAPWAVMESYAREILGISSRIVYADDWAGIRARAYRGEGGSEWDERNCDLLFSDGLWVIGTLHRRKLRGGDKEESIRIGGKYAAGSDVIYRVFLDDAMGLRLREWALQRGSDDCEDFFLYRITGEMQEETKKTLRLILKEAHNPDGRMF